MWTLTSKYWKWTPIVQTSGPPHTPNFWRVWGLLKTSFERANTLTFHKICYYLPVANALWPGKWQNTDRKSWYGMFYIHDIFLPGYNEELLFLKKNTASQKPSSFPFVPFSLQLIPMELMHMCGERKYCPWRVKDILTGAYLCQKDHKRGKFQRADRSMPAFICFHWHEELAEVWVMPVNRLLWSLGNLFYTAEMKSH